VTGRVRVLVQDDDGASAAVDDEAGLVVRLDGAAEDATGLLVGALNVLEPPGCPESAHDGLVSGRAPHVLLDARV
jgi:hypothetical protein